MRELEGQGEFGPLDKEAITDFSFSAEPRLQVTSGNSFSSVFKMTIQQLQWLLLDSRS